MHGGGAWRGCVHSWRGCSHMASRFGDKQELPTALWVRTVPLQHIQLKSQLCNRSESGGNLAEGPSLPPRAGGGGPASQWCSAGPGGAGRGAGMVLGWHSTAPIPHGVELILHSTAFPCMEGRKEGQREAGRKDRWTDSTAPCSYRDGADDHSPEPSSIPSPGCKSQPRSLPKHLVPP